jgi:hypothetical protein
MSVPLSTYSLSTYCTVGWCSNRSVWRIESYTLLSIAREANDHSGSYCDLHIAEQLAWRDREADAGALTNSKVVIITQFYMIHA